jgi:hypothetical protein
LFAYRSRTVFFLVYPRCERFTESSSLSQGKTDGEKRGELEDFFLAAEISEGAEVGDDEGGGETVFGADLAEVDAAVFEGEAAAVAVVADPDELALEGLVGEAQLIQMVNTLRA